MNCFACGSDAIELVLNLGSMPIANNFLLTPDDKEPTYPLRLCICTICKLMQLDHALKREEIFNQDYPYFSGVSRSWKSHCLNFVNEVILRSELNSKSFVVEIASNDGTLLEFFKSREVQTLGVEPTPGPAKVAQERGLSTIQAYFDTRVSEDIVLQFGKADLIVANNVYAHLSELSDFTNGIRKLLKSTGVASIEVAYLLDLVIQGAFDTIYHEHFTYFSLTFAVNFFRKHGLRVYDVERLSVHGGSIRLWICHEDSYHREEIRVVKLLEKEIHAGLGDVDSLRKMQVSAENKRLLARDFVLSRSAVGKKVIGFGAPAKGNTFLNFCKFTSADIHYLVDGSPYKQGRFSPGARIPVLTKDHLTVDPPDTIIILPWNIRNEIGAEIKEYSKKAIEIVSFFPQLSTL